MAPPTMVTDDNTDGAIWVTYSELAAARNTDRPTAKRLAMRRKWRRMQGNDGNARVLVPREAMAPAERHPGVNTDGDTGRQNGVDAALIEAVATLRADAETLRVALDREAARAAKAESKLAAAERATE
jgi:hypothetical protein